MSDNDKDVNNNEELDNNQEPADSGPTKIGGGKGFSPFETGNDAGGENMPDDVPAVSMTKKKNAMIFIAGFAVMMFLVYSLLSGGAPKNLPRTEMQQMKNENRIAAVVPAGIKGKDNDVTNSVSASAASPGSDMGGNVPAMPMMEKNAQKYNIQESLPPPPTLPPVFDPASIYVSENSGSGGGGAVTAPQQPAAASFSNRYTKKRSRLPEAGGGTPDDGFSDSTTNLDPEAQKRMEDDRRKRVESSMFIGGGGNLNQRDGNNTDSKDAADGAEDGFIMGESSAGKTSVTIRKDLEAVILQGKILDAVLETAINTDLPGKLRAIVSRDVYSESGKRVVIPKGSRLIGSYATDVKFGQARVYVIWSRVIRPDGVDAVLDGNEDLIATDALGRSGVYGDLDNRFFEIFGSSILLSSLTVAFAVAADAASGDNSGGSTTTSGVGGSTTTTTGNASSEGISQAVKDLGTTTSNVAKQYFKTTPRITVDQGTKIKIFVNKDIIFPPSYFSNGMAKTGTQFLN